MFDAAALRIMHDAVEVERDQARRRWPRFERLGDIRRGERRRDRLRGVIDPHAGALKQAKQRPSWRRSASE